MGIWEYRVMKRRHPGSDEEFYGVYEVYYEGDSPQDRKPSYWSELPDGPQETSLESLIKTLGFMVIACGKEILDHDDEPSGEVLEEVNPEECVDLDTALNGEQENA